MRFIRHAQHRKKRLGKTWRRPRGLQNKMRLEHKGHRPVVKQGYMSPADERGTRKGRAIVTVYNAADLEGLDPQRHGIVIGAVGQRKKIELLSLIAERKLTLLRGDAEQYLRDLTVRFESRHKKAAERQKEREEKQREREQAAEQAEKQGKLEEAVEAAEQDGTEQDGQPHRGPEKTEEDIEKEKVLTKAR